MQSCLNPDILKERGDVFEWIWCDGLQVQRDLWICRLFRWQYILIKCTGVQNTRLPPHAHILRSKRVENAGLNESTYTHATAIHYYTALFSKWGKENGVSGPRLSNPKETFCECKGDILKFLKIQGNYKIWVAIYTFFCLKSHFNLVDQVCEIYI